MAATTAYPTASDHRLRRHRRKANSAAAIHPQLTTGAHGECAHRQQRDRDECDALHMPHVRKNLPRQSIQQRAGQHTDQHARQAQRIFTVSRRRHPHLLQKIAAHRMRLAQIERRLHNAGERTHQEVDREALVAPDFRAAQAEYAQRERRKDQCQCS
jgi:hypothetical protein